MKTFYSIGISLCLFLQGLCSPAQAQQPHAVGPAYALGTTQEMVRQLSPQVAVGAARRGALPTIALRVSATRTFTAQVNYHNELAGTGQYLAGQLQGVPHSSFLLGIKGPKVQGHILLRDTKQAYRYTADAQGNVSVQQVDINSVICVDYHNAAGQQRQVAAQANRGTTSQGLAVAATSLQSYPGARGCILLDFDGQVVTSSYWTSQNNNNPINAAPAGLSDAAIRNFWEVVSEDFRPFSLNVTTDEAVYNTYPNNLRQRCIVTPTDVAAPGAGGVAFAGTFNTEFADTDDTPCWVFTTQSVVPKSASHEVGHTLGLRHDGISSPFAEYYNQTGTIPGVWAPIMGLGSNKSVVQWSKGEYPLPTNTEDDLAIIAGPKNNVGYRADDHSNTIAGATILTVSGSGFSGTGIIERNSDQDYFKFTTVGGPLNLSVNTVGHDGDLDIAARLFNSSGSLVGTYDTPGAGNLGVSITAALSAGTYYLQVDGTGSGGNPSTYGEYSDYASLGSYTIFANSETPVATLYAEPSYQGSPVTLPVGNYSLAALQARGVADNTLSSLAVNGGYQVVLYDGDNFTGDSLLVQANEDGLGNNPNNNWDNRTTSLKVQVQGQGLKAVTLYRECASFNAPTVSLSPGNYPLAALLARGQPNNNLCGLDVGVDYPYEIVIYDGDNFTGDSLVISRGTYSTYTQLGADWVNRATSIRVRIKATAFTYATLHSDCSFFSGTAVSLPVGNYTQASLQAKGLADKSLSGLEVSTGYQVVLYDGDNFTGASLVVGNITECLTSATWDNRATSLRVRAAVPPPATPVAPARATLYQSCGYGGTIVNLPVGNYTLANLQARGIPNKALSSLQVSTGYQVILYEGDNFTGLSIAVGADNDCLTSADWNDRATSLRVQAGSPVLSSITLTPSAATVDVGTTQQFTAQPKDQSGNALSLATTLAWTVSGGGTISPNGLFTASTAGGPFTVTAASGNIKGTASITVVTPLPVLTSITVTPAKVSLVVGATQQFTAQAKDQNGNPISAKLTRGAIAVESGRVDSSGLFTAIAVGDYNPVTAYAYNSKGQYIVGEGFVTIVAAPAPVLTTLTVTPATSSVLIGATQQFTAQGKDQSGAAIATKPTWTVSGGGTISSSGVFTASTVGGPFTVTATSGSIKGTASVTVKATPITPVLTRIVLTPATASVAAGATQQFTAQGKDQAGNSFATTPTWTVSGGGSISSAGLFTASAVGGPFTVTATSGSIKGTASVTVTPTTTGSPNLALKKPVRASSVEHYGTPTANAVDGNAGTRWSTPAPSATGLTVAQANAQWLRVDLGATYTVNRVKLKWENAYGKDYVLEIAPDTVNWTPLKVESGNTVFLKDYTGLSGTGRFVRMRGITRGSRYGYSLWEMEVYGTSSARGILAGPSGSSAVAEELSVFPNPATHMVTLTGLGQLPTTIAVYDAKGAVVQHLQLDQPSASTVLDVSKLNNGLYFIQATSQGMVQRQRFTKE